MSSLDDELALFEAELNELESAEETKDEKPPTSSSAAPVAASSSSLATPPQPVKSVLMASALGSMGGSAANAFGGGLLLPPQLRNHPSAAPSSSGAPILPASVATIESKPQLYSAAAKTPAQMKEDEAVKEMKTMAIPADIELAELKKARDRNTQNSILGQVQRGERRMKRFMRSAGGESWEDPSLAEWDPNDFRIFCGDLGNEVSDEVLAKAFRKYPTFQKAKVVRDGKSNKPKGYGFVSFKSQEDYVRAMRDMDGKYVGNRPIKLRRSNWKDRNMDIVRKKQKQKKKLGLMS